MNYTFGFDVHVLPMFYLPEKTRDLVYGDRMSEKGKLFLAKRVCVIQQCLNDLEADFNFYGPQNSMGNKITETTGMRLQLHETGQ